ncbi:Uncharacterised protein [Mycobacteroides abscessus subsp. bolletii]|nr:hypothetical protein [Mycobacteroides abscessus]SKR94592.1 Uncharacterised protein [Mycobacteroides abscessus subsp. bolletii]SKS02844.1 Uncharacterised protein [Mycobacteroides abscessus subsp. bolletii]DAZ90175.1 TPA_asm: hypothetical protein PROPHIFVLQ01-1_89 [Mycobacterium phage prophiFVLQ01-1]
MTNWKVTLKTEPRVWSTIEVNADTAVDAIAQAQELLGEYPVTSVM